MTDVALRFDQQATPAGAQRDLARWGMLLFLINEGMLFASLIASYFFLATANSSWPPAGVAKPTLELPLIMTVALTSSSVVLVAAERALKAGRRTAYGAGVLTAIGLGMVFVGLQAKEYIDKLRVIGPTQHAYGSMFYTITGLHGTHVVFGMLFLAWALRRQVKGATADSPALKNASLYWHFVDGVWLVILTSLYLSPRWL
jgi:heme/copper-type cytochrome/quinol oxidase subunit 3